VSRHPIARAERQGEFEIGNGIQTVDEHAVGVLDAEGTETHRGRARRRLAELQHEIEPAGQHQNIESVRPGRERRTFQPGRERHGTLTPATGSQNHHGYEQEAERALKHREPG
jgi:hypothetical protein